ncbi:MAG: outer membrane beta-barrel protein [Pirellulales bacterium]|nr:outer membrane beta-barrel protein [Pirellulales bacterium]
MNRLRSEVSTMPRHRRQRARFLAWLIFAGCCAVGAEGRAQLLFDPEDDVEYTQPLRQVQRVQHVEDANEPAKLAVPSPEPEAVLEASPYEIVYEDGYGCGECGDGHCGGCGEFRPGPVGWLSEHFQQMKVQQKSTSWLNRPVSFGIFAGNLWADDLIKGRVNQSDGFVGGYYLGEDLTINWGWELRLTLSDLDVTYDAVPLVTRTNEIILFDLNFHYYPWENARWRPYTSFGFGVGQFDFADELDRRVRKTTFGLPIGVGMKYMIHRTSAFRIELMDNIAFSAGPMDTQHNVSLTAGLEIRFGGMRRSYWPWTPGQGYGYW